jgi:hypothetical protein
MAGPGAACPLAAPDGGAGPDWANTGPANSPARAAATKRPGRRGLAVRGALSDLEFRCFTATP